MGKSRAGAGANRAHKIERLTGRPRIVVGVSPSAAGRAALNVAIDSAVHQAHPLHLVRVWRAADRFLSAPARAMDALVAEEHAEQSMFATVCADARYRAADVEVTGELVPGDLYAGLLEQAKGAELLVLGLDARAGDAVDSSGSVTGWFTAHAECPVIVVDARERIVDYHASRSLPTVERAVG